MAIEYNLSTVDLIRDEKVWSVIRKMKIKKTVGSNRVTVEEWKVLGSLYIGWLTKFVNKVLVEEKFQKRGERVLWYRYNG